MELAREGFEEVNMHTFFLCSFLFFFPFLLCLIYPIISSLASGEDSISETDGREATTDGHHEHRVRTGGGREREKAIAE